LEKRVVVDEHATVNTDRNADELTEFGEQVATQIRLVVVLEARMGVWGTPQLKVQRLKWPGWGLGHSSTETAKVKMARMGSGALLN
jgi:hypothetical protein